MDCNREEAIRAKQLAEKKMEAKDFSTALKMAQKAQQLYPQLENISQLILVCEVHCSAEKKPLFGSEKDWYAILNIDSSSDDISIKKQYRKLALILHPDKNKFSGSTDAFKLIGEAQRVLLDREKRLIFDSKRRAAKQQSSRQSNVVHNHNHNHYQRPQPPQQHPWNQTTFAQNHSVFQHGFANARPGVKLTFWTVCPFCSVRYQFYRDDVLNKVIHCQSCKKSFTAFEMNAQGGGGGGGGVPVAPHPRQYTKPTEGIHRNYPTKPVFTGSNSQPVKPQNMNRKRKKKVEESSESSDSESSSESEEEEVEENIEISDDDENENENEKSNGIDGKQQRTNPGEQPRRSSRPKRDVSYKENVVEIDDDPTLSSQSQSQTKKKSKSTATATSSSFDAPKVEEEDSFWKEEVRKEVSEEEVKEVHHTKKGNEQSQKEKEKVKENIEEEEEEEEEEEPELYECPDPEFSDFEKDRKETSFAKGQIWAVYDTEDAMPRFYAYIRNVLSPKPFNLQITWLKPVPENDGEELWLEEELPVSCGNFKRGKHDKAEDLPTFSHVVKWESQPKGIFKIIPRKGETWALFKNWSIKWYCSTESITRKYEYEFVEVLSDFDEKKGVDVFCLEKVKGFTCVYSRKKDGDILISASDKFRFSHMVPSFRMSGEEREGVPEGSFELDPASLPSTEFEQGNL